MVSFFFVHTHTLYFCFAQPTHTIGVMFICSAMRKSVRICIFSALFIWSSRQASKRVCLCIYAHHVDVAPQQRICRLHICLFRGPTTLIQQLAKPIDCVANWERYYTKSLGAAMQCDECNESYPYGYIDYVRLHEVVCGVGMWRRCAIDMRNDGPSGIAEEPCWTFPHFVACVVWVWGFFFSSEVHSGCHTLNVYGRICFQWSYKAQVGYICIPWWTHSRCVLEGARHGACNCVIRAGAVDLGCRHDSRLIWFQVF